MGSKIASAIIAWLEEQKTAFSASQSEEITMCQDSLSSVFGLSLPACVANSRGLLKTWSEAPLSSSSSSSAATAAGFETGDLASPASAASPTPPSAADEAQAEALKAGGNAALEKGDVRGAEELYSAAIALVPEGKNSHIYLSNRAMARMKLNDWAGSAEDARASVRLSPGYAKGWSRLGAALQQLGSLAEAESAFERSLALDPSSTLVKSNIAECKKLQGKGSGGGGAAGGLPAGMEELAPLLSDPELMGIMSKCMSDPTQLMQHVSWARDPLLFHPPPPPPAAQGAPRNNSSPF